MSGDMSIGRLRAELAAQEFFSVPEASRVLRYDERTVRKMCVSGEIPGAIMLRRRWRIPTWWLRQQTRPPSRAA